MQTVGLYLKQSVSWKKLSVWIKQDNFLGKTDSIRTFLSNLIDNSDIVQ